MIEHAYELRLREPRPAGAIFALKHMGWSDGRELTVRGNLASVDMRTLPDTLVQRIAAGENPWAVLASASFVDRVSVPGNPRRWRLPTLESMPGLPNSGWAFGSEACAGILPGIATVLIVGSASWILVRRHTRDHTIG